MENFPEGEFMQQISARVNDIESLVDDEIDLLKPHVIFLEEFR